MIANNLVYLILVIAMLVELQMADTNQNGNGNYLMAGPRGLSASFDPTSGVLMVNRILNQPIDIQPYESLATPLTNYSSETTTKFSHRKQIQTAAVVMQIVSLQQSNTTNNAEVEERFVSLDECHFDNVTVNQSDCYIFICILNNSNLHQDICFVSLDHPLKSVVKITYLIDNWVWCPLLDQSLCGLAELDLVLKLWIDKDLSIAKANKTTNTCSFNLGNKNAYVQFDKQYTETGFAYSSHGSTVPKFTLSKTYEAKFVVTLNHTIQSPVSNLTYELVIDPGYERDVIIISGSQIKMAGFLSSYLFVFILMLFD